MEKTNKDKKKKEPHHDHQHPGKDMTKEEVEEDCYVVCDYVT